MVTDKDIERFGQDGVAFLPGTFAQQWIELLHQRIEKNISRPSERGMDPDHSAVMTEFGLMPGDRPGTGLYPQVWARG